MSNGQCIVQSARPQSTIAPYVLGLSVKLDMKYRPKWLINQLSHRGFTVTYEIGRFKRSSVLSNQEIFSKHH